MFTGLIEEKGVVRNVTIIADSSRITIDATVVLDGLSVGDSISVSGVCLTVISFDETGFTADVMAQSLRMSCLSDAKSGTVVNLERAAQLGDRLGGHIVQGHIDETTHVISVTDSTQWRVLRLHLPENVSRLLVDKGSITLDGVSLTVSQLGVETVKTSESEAKPVEPSEWFEVSLIPETLTETTLGHATIGTRLNLESDILARHIQRLVTRTTGDFFPTNPDSIHKEHS